MTAADDRDDDSQSSVPGPVAAYKTLLRDMIDRRPSGTRQRIAQALGKHKSFVSQITNPVYPVPVPAKHLATIFELCHASAAERRRFVAAYGEAHPGRRVQTVASTTEASTITIEVPALKDPRRRAELVDSIRTYASQAIALAQKWESREQDEKGDTDAPNDDEGGEP